MVLSAHMDPKFLKPYDPLSTEPDIYRKWESSGYFNPDNLPDKGDPFTIIMPPPNANGSLHAGHAVFVTIEDLIIRYQRMRGKRALWLPGADHAGFETQVVYEKKLEKEGRSRFGMEPDALRKEILDFTLANKSFMEGQMRELGASCDWSREKFTLDADIEKTVYATFKRLYDDKLAYRGKRIVNWCAKHQTSLSNLETEYVERVEPYWYLKYGPFVISTSRPETKFGDKYVVMHPHDPRYASYKEGDTMDVEWISGTVTATVIKDEAVDMEAGTGVMTITPWHDKTDFEIAKRHNLPYEQVIDERGKLLPIAGEFAGMKILEARPKIVEKLSEKGLLEKTDEKYTHAVQVCYKCGNLIEPQVKDQWFVTMKPLADKAIAAIERDEIRFYPDNYKKIILHWLTNIEDWNISRQIAWGIPIPAWYRGDEIAVQKEMPDGDGWVRDIDTFDTWFSSGQWPFATLGYPDSSDFKSYYPTQVMETAGEIIFFWVARMIMFGLYVTDRVPFSTVYLHGLVVARDGQKMSKSRGNVISPLDISKKYGTDALRMGLIIGNTPGTSTRLYEEKIKAYKLFANKLWNISRFVFEQAPEMDGALTKDDAVVLEAFNALSKDVTKDIEEYRFYMAGEKLYHYVWHELADKLLEESKVILKDGQKEAKASRSALLNTILADTLKLLHPFMPFITEEIWTHVPTNDGTLLMVSAWPHTS